MYISFTIEKTKFNLRVTVLLKAPSGYIFEKEKSGFCFPIGGRIKLKEDSESAAIREVEEEIGLKIKELNYTATIENFFLYNKINFHEINIIYKAEVNQDPDLLDNFCFIKDGNIDFTEIKPKKIKDIIRLKNEERGHCIIKENN